MELHAAGIATGSCCYLNTPGLPPIAMEWFYWKDGTAARIVIDLPLVSDSDSGLDLPDLSSMQLLVWEIVQLEKPIDNVPIYSSIPVGDKKLHKYDPTDRGLQARAGHSVAAISPPKETTWRKKTVAPKYSFRFSPKSLHGLQCLGLK